MSARWTEQDLAAYLHNAQRRVRDGSLTAGQQHYVSEAVFQGAVLRLAKQSGWMAYHTWSSKKSPEGFPDLVLAKAGQPLYVCELKTDTGIVSQAQQAWLEALAGCTGVVGEVWRPAQLSEIVERLRA